jgi:hypothetical protein
MSDLREWLKAFPRHDVEKRIEELETELVGLYDAIKMHNKLGGGAKTDAAPPEPVKPTRPEAISFVLKEAGKPLKSGEIRSQLVERGWLGDSPRATKQFYSTMTRLKREERLVHRADGAYELPKTREDGQRPGLFR